MKIATYNIWNSSHGMPARNRYVVSEIQKISADIICLQEVSSKEQAGMIASQTQYKYLFFEAFAGDEEGLCILSRYPFQQKISWIGDANAIYTSVLLNEKKVGIVNMHLPWESALLRQKYITIIVNRAKQTDADYMFFMGDFNCSDNSDVHRFLLGECTLNNLEANPCFYDLAEAYAEIEGKALESTLKFRENPRFRGNTIEKNQRFDRILLRNTYPAEVPVVKKFQVWGQTVYSDIKLAASDHYGAVADIEF